MNLAELTKKLQSEETAWAMVEAWRWPTGPICPHCGVINHAYYLTPKKPRTTSTGKVSYRRLWKCGDCSKQFSALVGTVMEDSKIPLSKWILAFYMVISGKNAVSAHELHRDLGITYKSAWFMEHRIRHALAETSYHTLLAGTVEADETYVGGKRKHIPGVSHTDLKTPVVTLVERGGEVRSSVMTTDTSKNIRAHLQAHVSPTADLMTDQAQVYSPAGCSFASHETVDHARDEWAIIPLTNPAPRM
jgi:transposase-like protein